MYLFDKTKLYSHYLWRNAPDAVATVKGSAAYPRLWGNVSFYQLKEGVLAAAQFGGLPVGEGPCGSKVFALHIHKGKSCTGDEKDPFAAASTHYNPLDCPHPSHAGDMPPLFGNQGTAWYTFLTDRFAVKDIIGRAVIVHAGPDDFTSQPAGNAGAKIACGIIIGK